MRSAAALLVGVCLACGRADHKPSAAAPAPFAPAALAPGALPVHGALPPFALTDQEGAPFDLARLRGKVWISDFIFTTCSMACPLLTARMALLQRRLAEAGETGVQLLSISIAPATDTPPVLKSYAGRYRADPARWTFLTGATEPLQLAVTEAYRRAPRLEVNTGTASGFSALHGQVFELLDGEGRIRGYYPKSDAGLDALLADARKLRAAQP